MAGVDDAGPFAARPVAALLARRADRVERGDRDRTDQHVGQMRTAGDAADLLVHRLAPAGADFQPDQRAVGRRDVAADRERARFRHGLGVLDDQVVVDGDAQRHAVQRLAGGDAAAILVVERIGLGVGQAGLDVPQAVVALVAAADDLARVQVLAGRGLGQRHGGPRCGANHQGDWGGWGGRQCRLAYVADM